jgi:outer membrane autotransporter protein
VVRNHQVQSLRSQLGAHVSRLFPLPGGWSLEPGVEALWSYELLSVDQTVDARFAGSPASGFSIVGDRPERNRALLAAGLVARLGGALALSASYGADLSGDETSQSVQAGVRFVW